MSSSFEDQFKDVTSLITLFEQCLQDTQHFIDDMAQYLPESVKSDVITEAERHRLLSYSAKKSTLLVVGQTNSGKSSFVNELLGGSYMPTSELPCTSRIIRLKYSDENYYQVHIYIRIAEATLPAILFSSTYSCILFGLGIFCFLRPDNERQNRMKWSWIGPRLRRKSNTRPKFAY